MADQYHFDPDTYLDAVRAEIDGYDELQARLADATSSVRARSILDLGSGTGTTAQQVLARHPGASLVGLDESDAMLGHARALLPAAEFRVGRLEDGLPDGAFDLVVSAFAVHHLPGPSKAVLFEQVADRLQPGGRFALLDVVVPRAPVTRPVPLDPGYDAPSTVDDQLDWLATAGMVPRVELERGDIAILVADRA